MARYSRRRARRRTSRRKSRRAPRRNMAKRFGGKRRGGLTQHTQYVISRQREDIMYNYDPLDGPPQVAINPGATGYINIITGDPGRGPELARHINFGLTFDDRLNQLQNFPEFQAMFQYYKILRITRTFTPVFAPDNQGTYGDDDETFGFATPSLLYLKDRDSNNPFYNGDLMECQGGKRRQIKGRSFTHSYTPTPVDPVAMSTSGPSIFAAVRSSPPWINTGSPQISHYGMRYGTMDWPGPSNGQGVEGDAVPCAWRITTKYTIALKGVK